MYIQPAQGFGHCPRISRNIIGKLQARFLIINPESAAGINVVDAVSIRA